jgi:FkbM family methyltransferase
VHEWEAQVQSGEDIAGLINAFYDRQCSDPALLTTYETESYRDQPSWVDGLFSKPKMHEADYVVFGHFRDPATAILDVGADFGYSVGSMCAAGCEAAIFSIEALPWYGEHLSRIRDRDPVRFDFRIGGVGDRSGAFRFVTPVINGVIESALTSANERNHRDNLWRNVEQVLQSRKPRPNKLDLKFIVTELAVTTLDAIVGGYRGPLCLDRIEAVKLDVEGHEAAVLSGARTVLSNHKPLLMMEGANRSAEAREVLAELDYAFATRTERQLRLDDAISYEANGYFVHRSRLGSYSVGGLLIER